MPWPVFFCSIVFDSPFPLDEQGQTGACVETLVQQPDEEAAKRLIAQSLQVPDGWKLSRIWARPISSAWIIAAADHLKGEGAPAQGLCPSATPKPTHLN